MRAGILASRLSRVCELQEALKPVNEKNVCGDPTLESSHGGRLTLGVCSPELGVVGVGPVTPKSATSKMKLRPAGVGALLKPPLE